MERWVVSAKKEDFNEWGRLLGIDPVVARILRNRDILSVEEARSFLYGTPEDMHGYALLPDIEQAVRVICEALESEKKIRIIGDYDVDGVTSSYILFRGLSLLGAEVSVRIPHRIKDGYGMNDAMVREAATDGIDMIITCDNGIAAMNQVKLACELGLSVVITDHHEVPFELDKEGNKEQLLPPALAVVDPKRFDSEYPFENICGAFVAYKLMEALKDRTGNVSLKKQMQELMVFAAMGTVCDVMPLLNENRILVREGLRLAGEIDHPGLLALMEVNGLRPKELTCYHVGFVLGPCINATGRLDSADAAFDLFCEEKYGNAVRKASDIKALNDSRKNMTVMGEQEAIDYVEAHQLKDRKVWVIFLPELHESLAGIIAGKVRERFHHPVFVLTRGAEGVKGSGRSIPAYHMYDKLTEVKQLLTKFGGHALAAGLSLREEDVARFEEALNENAGLADSDFDPIVRIDVPMPLYYGNMTLARQLKSLEPTGTGNEIPLFAEKDVVVTTLIRFGKNKEYIKLGVLASGNFRGQVIYFGAADLLEDFLIEKFGAGIIDTLEHGQGHCPISITYQLSINSYMGRDSIQYIMQNYC